MSIFEDKKHNGLPYVGQKPVSAVITPEDTKNATYGIIDHTNMQNASVRNLPNRDKP